jgi:lipid-binding SYLF domain-containing protein
MTMKLQPLAASIGLILLSLVASTAAFAHSKAELDASAGKALKHFYALNSANRELASKAAGILIFSRVTKGGAGVAGEFGEGVLQRKGTTVDYYSVGSASVGLTLGLAHHSEIIMFMTQGALDRFMASAGWSVGADTAVAIVSEGSGGQYDSAVTGKPILGFVFGEKGLIGDFSLEGSKITKIKSTG